MELNRKWYAWDDFFLALMLTWVDFVSFNSITYIAKIPKTSISVPNKNGDIHISRLNHLSQRLSRLEI
jgi:hypothetical protein